MSHKLLETINVKQGDCLILRPRNGCCYDRQVFIVDTGNGSYDFTKSLSVDEDYHVILTHAHADHINGVNLLLATSKLKKMKSLILPYYHNESILIAEALLNLKGMRGLSDKWGLKWQLNQVVANQRVLINLAQDTEIKFVKDGDYLCNHMHILNPPYQCTDHLSKLDEQYISELSELFDGRFSTELSTFLYMLRRTNNISDSPHISGLFLKHSEDDSMLDRANFFVGFLLENRQKLIDFNEHPSSAKLYTLIERKKLKDHQACIVFRCNYDKRWFLFGGDADISVWNRLIREGNDISAYYLKVPHHGSKKNINSKIMKRIDPTIAIISHDNGRFGRAKDAHPNQEVLDLIKSDGINLISTNDIIKSGNVVWRCFGDNAKDGNIDVVDV